MAYSVFKKLNMPTKLVTKKGSILDQNRSLPGLWERTYADSSNGVSALVQTRLLRSGILLQRIQLEKTNPSEIVFSVKPYFEMRDHHQPALETNLEEEFLSEQCTVSADFVGISVDRQDLGKSVSFAARDSAKSEFGFCKNTSNPTLYPKYKKDKERYGEVDGNGRIQNRFSIDFEIQQKSTVIWQAVAVDGSKGKSVAAVLDQPEKEWQADGIFHSVSLGSRSADHISSAGETGLRYWSGNKELGQALDWSIFAASQMFMNFNGPGLIAGIPWFEQYWGRDTAISLPGTFLVSGSQENAKLVIENMLRLMDMDPESPSFGRIPNRLDANGVLFNTADALPHFMISTALYFDNFQDSKFLNEISEQILTSIKAERARIDSEGLYTHDDQDTWMDGKLGSWVASPRGNRAVEVQGLWYVALKKWSELFLAKGDKLRAEQIYAWAGELRQSFRQNYLNLSTESTGFFADHIRADGSKADEIRPNILLFMQFEESNDLFMGQERFKIVERMVSNELFAPHGVRSMSPNSKIFNPYHQSSGFCSQYACDGHMSYHPYHNFGSHAEGDHMDWAYHNGTVWQWLSGSAYQVLDQTDFDIEAAGLFDTLQSNILNGQSPGHLAEVKDGAASGNPTGWDKGTPMQTWSVAEFNRMIVNHKVGYDRKLGQNKIIIRPNAEILQDGFNIWDLIQLDKGPQELKVAMSKDRILVNNPAELTIELRLENKRLGNSWSVSLDGKEYKAADYGKDGGLKLEITAKTADIGVQL